jgi:hypothetical protein
MGTLKVTVRQISRWVCKFKGQRLTVAPGDVAIDQHGGMPFDTQDACKERALPGYD